MDYNGFSGTRQRLTNNGTCDSHPSFAPDGNKSVIQRQSDNGRAEIWIMDADGKTVIYRF
jgi:Tol biopolymer transport system component